MRTLIIYTSVHHGNTEKVARAMADEMKAKLITAKELDKGTARDFDCIGIGSGIYFGRHHQTIFNALAHLNGHQHKKVFIFSTGGAMLPVMRFFFHGKLRRALKRHGFKVVGEFNCPGWDTVWPLNKIGGIKKGRPNEKDLAAAKKFASGIMAAGAKRQ